MGPDAPLIIFTLTPKLSDAEFIASLISSSVSVAPTTTSKESEPAVKVSVPEPTVSVTSEKSPAVDSSRLPCAKLDITILKDPDDASSVVVAVK